MPQNRVPRERFAMVGFLTAIGVVLAFLTVPTGADPYDEGLIAYGAHLTLHGRLPAADFYAPYPPGAFLGVALAFRLFGERLLVERWFSALLAALVGPLGFWMVTGFGETSGRGGHAGYRIAATAGLAVTLLLGSGWVTPVRSGALALVLAAGLALRASVAGGRPISAFLCGALCGAASLWRLDFGAHALVATAVAWALFAGRDAEEDGSWGRRPIGVGILLLGAMVVTGPPLGWLLARGGRRAADSLFWWPLAGTASAHAPSLSHVAALFGPLTAVVLLAVALPRLRRDADRAETALWLLIVGLGFLGYALGLNNSGHFLPLRVIALLLAGLAATTSAAPLPVREGGGRREGGKEGTRERGNEGRSLLPSFTPSLVFLALVATIALPPLGHLIQCRIACQGAPVRLPGPRGEGIRPTARCFREYERIADALRHDLPPGKRLFCGTCRHDRYFHNDSLLYFLCDRDSGTYYWCLDAGVTTTARVQAEMVRELEVAPVDAVLLRVAHAEDSERRIRQRPGASLLDDYLCRNFRLVTTWHDHRLYLRCHSLPRSTAAVTDRPAT